MHSHRSHGIKSFFWFRVTGVFIALIFVLPGCRLQQNPNWQDTVYATTGGGAIPYLIGYAINEAIGAMIEPTESESFVITGICARARDGDAAQRASVAWHYRNGWAPVSVDPVEAYKWFTLADIAGYESAIRFRTELADEMSAEQITDAEHLAAAWSPEAEACEFELETADESATD